jgi:hypothetical protein
VEEMAGSGSLMPAPVFMNAAKGTLRLAAFLVGIAASCGVGAGAYREFHGGPAGVVPLPLIAIVTMAGVLLLISQWRELARDPWMVPSAIFATSVFFYSMTLPGRIGLYELHTASGASWLTVVLKVLGYMAFATFNLVPSVIVYRGTHSLLSTLGNALLARKTRRP